MDRTFGHAGRRQTTRSRRVPGPCARTPRPSEETAAARAPRTQLPRPPRVLQAPQALGHVALETGAAGGQRSAAGYLELLVLALIQKLLEAKGAFCHHGHWHLPGRHRRRTFPVAGPLTDLSGVAPAMTQKPPAERRRAGEASVPVHRRTSPLPAVLAAALAGALGALED